jgi:hypothetical protein
MNLWDMQDIGGCRAVVLSIEDVNQLVQAFKSSDIKHKLVGEKDYIEHPKSDGYRSRHLIYRYFSDKNTVFNNLKIEVQIRTPIQHAWATAVETVDIFTQQALKSSQGDRDWARFFKLMGNVMALSEGTRSVPSTPSGPTELKRQLRACAEDLKVDKTLRGFTGALRVIRRPSVRRENAAFFLLSLDNVKEELSVTVYDRTALQEASQAYAKNEKRIRESKNGTDAVLVSVSSIHNLERAYPNYFADTRRFLQELRKALK